MSVPKLSISRRYRSRYGIKPWPTASYAEMLKVSDCTDILLYLKRSAGLSDDAVVWDRVKINALVKSTIKRKIWFHATTLALLLLTAGVLLISAARIFSEFSTVRELKITETEFNLLFAGFTSAIILFFWKRRSVGRDRNALFRDYFSEGLNASQKLKLEQVILRLKENSVQLFEIGNYEKLYPVGSIGWSADNWFLLLTGNEKDRLGIWMDSQYPLGSIVVTKDTSTEKTSLHKTSNESTEQLNDLSDSNDFCENELMRERVKGSNSRYIFSNKVRLETFINRIDKFALSHFYAAWLEAINVLLDNHEAYKEYLEGKLDLGQRKEFERLFTPIFAEISDKYKVAHQSATISEREKLDIYGFGVDNTRKFLTGRNKNIDDWIGRNTPKSS